MGSLIYLLGVISLSIVFIVLASNYLRLHPFISLILACFFVGFGVGLEPLLIVEALTHGFGSILSGIGLIVVFGTVIGICMEKSGSLYVIADVLLKMVRRSTTMAVGILGAVVSIPVFCDSGFVILSRLTKVLSVKTHTPSASLSLALAAGLYTTHTLIPPTPGPIAVAGTLGHSDQLGIVMITGILVSIPILLMSVFLAGKLGRSMEISKTNEEIVDQNHSQFHIIWALTPIFLPVFFIGLGTVLQLVGAKNVGMLLFLGKPMVSLLIGSIVAMFQLWRQTGSTKQHEWVQTSIKQAGPIVLITGAGGAFGSVLKATELSSLLSDSFLTASMGFPGIFFVAFVLAAVLKTAQGSSTSALVIASAVLAPLISGVTEIGAFSLALLVMSFGAGAMTVSHTNDSYFWVVTQFSGFSIKQGYRGFTLMTLIQGLTTMVVVLILYAMSLLF